MAVIGLGDVRDGPRPPRRVALFASIALVLSACGTAAPSEEPSTTQDPPGTAAPSSIPTAPGEGSELVVAMGSIGNGEWAPARTGVDMQEVSKHLFSPLTRINRETREYDGLLAESYSLSADGTTWTFKLRPGIPFHGDWGTVTAEDVKFTWGEWIGEDSNHGLAPTLSQAVDGNMDNFEIVSELEFRLHTTQPVVALDVALSDSGNGLQVVPWRYHEEQGAAADANPIGTGPWRFVSYTPGVEMVMDAVPDHFFQAPQFDRLVLREIPDAAARLAQVQAGAVDLALLDSRLTGEAQAAGLEVRTIPDVANVFIILGGSYWGTEHLNRDAPWIQADEPDRGKAIREAMSLAIDRELILERVIAGMGTLAAGPIIQSENVPGLTDPAWSLPEYNLDLARQRLTDGGYPDGFPLRLFIYPRAIDLPSISEAVAGMWEELGLDVTREPGDEGVLDGYLNARDTDGLVWLKATGLKGEIVSELRPYRTDKDDDHLFYHPSIDDALTRMAGEVERADRQAIGRGVIDTLREDTLLITLFTADLPIVVGPRVGDWDPVPGLDELTSFETVTPAGG
jgi:peptide/nickel transport system substrate-binding protein